MGTPLPQIVLPPDIKLWFSADFGVLDGSSNPAADGAVCATVPDRSGYGFDCVQATNAKRPIMTFDACNGMPAMLFSGAQYLTHSYIGKLGTAFVVHKTTGSLSSDQAFMGAQSVSDVGSYYFKASAASPAGNSQLLYVTTGAGRVAWNAQAPAQASSYTVTAARTNGRIAELWQNGMLVASSIRTGSAIVPAVGGIIGADYVSATPSDLFTGLIGEGMIWDRALSLAEMARMFKYLSRWFGGPLTESIIVPTWGVTGNSDTQLAIAQSQDGVSFTGGAYASYAPPTGVCRDGGFLFDQAEAIWYLVHGTSNGGVASHVAQIGISSEGQLWRPYSQVDFSAITGTGAGSRVWAPKLFQDDDATVYCTAAVSTQGDSGGTPIGFQPAICKCGGDTLASGQWGAAVAITGSGITANLIDPHIDKVGSTYVLDFKDVASNRILICKSQKPTSGYVLVTTLGTADIEGPCRLDLGGGRVRLYYDKYVAGTGLAFIESNDHGVTFGPEQLTSGPFPLRHGAPALNILGAGAAPINSATAATSGGATRMSMGI